MCLRFCLSDKLLWLAGALGASLLGCSSDDDSGSSSLVSELRSDVERAPLDSPKLSAAAEDLREFAWSFYHQISTVDRNQAYSPFSIATAFAMMSGAAAGNTLTQLENALEFGESGEDLHSGYNSLILSLEALNFAGDEDREPQHLRVSNRLWLSSDLTPQEPWLDPLARYYGTGVQVADFAEDPDAIRQTVNDTVSDDTGGIIEELLPEHSVSASTVAILTNALYFTAHWSQEFGAESTEPAPFETLSGGEVQAPTMHVQGEFLYASTQEFEVVRLRFRSKELEMMVLVPSEPGTFVSTVNALDYSDLDALRAEMEPRLVDLALPKFAVTTALGLPDELKARGMIDIFDPALAELPHLAPGAYISDAFHQTSVEIDEEGATAAAATAILGTVGGRSLAEPVELRVDRPFVFWIQAQEQDVGIPLFLGHVVDPTQ